MNTKKKEVKGSEPATEVKQEGAGVPAEGAGVPAEAKSDKVQVCANKEKYTKTRTAAGKSSLHCGDRVALAFAGLSIDQKYELAVKLGVGEDADLRKKYGHLNIGMQGMSLANRVRGMVNQDDKLEEPKGVADKMEKLVAPLQEKAAKAEVAAKAKAAAEKKAQAAEKKAQAAEKKAQADAEAESDKSAA